ncbi:LamG domain-containing protein [candidate division WWE3 bacterium]|uniref:LamG domain-containing protein n=1 Tax=candidate division WWE3 bacterium TaxID=2053526 RepID=A0A955LJE4_UNCKA|nr:LamG domain-containing protein [candidate division WWE3 bacterium]
MEFKVARNKGVLVLSAFAGVVAVIFVGLMLLSNGSGKIVSASTDGYVYRYQSADSDYGRVLFGKGSSTLPSFKIDDGDVSLSMTYKPQSPNDNYRVERSDDKKTITFLNVDENTNLIYAVSGRNVIKEDIELIQIPTETLTYYYNFEVALKGLTYDIDSAGYVIPTFYDASNNTYAIPELIMTDENGTTSNLVNMVIQRADENDDNKLVATVAPNMQWLTSADRAYPVRIDPSVVKGNAPISSWRMDEGYGATVNDQTDNLNHLTVTNATWQMNGSTSGAEVGKVSVKFDGSGDYLSRTYDADFDFGTASFSVSMWVRIPTNAAGTDVILSRYGGAGFKIYSTDGVVCFGIDDDSTWDPDDTACSTAALNDASWHHVEAVKSSTDSITLYVDAIPVEINATTGADSSLSGTTPTLYLGIDSDGSSNSFEGYIDSVAIFDYARDATQVKADMFVNPQVAQVLGARTVDVATQGLVGYWKLDETSENGCSGGEDSCNSVGDYSHGTFNGNPTIDSTGKYGAGVNFDGTGDYIDLGDIDL